MEKIKLRALTISDMEKTLQWHNQQDISYLYSGHPFPVNLEMERKWYEKILASNMPVTVFGIEEITASVLIGITVLKDINFINRSAEFAIYIGEVVSRGKGYAKEATIKTLRFAFEKLNLNRISLKVLDENETAIHLYQGLGFLNEGTLRNSIFKNGRYHNELIFSILKAEFIDQ